MAPKPDAKGMESKRSAVSGQRSESERNEERRHCERGMAVLDRLAGSNTGDWDDVACNQVSARIPPASGDRDVTDSLDHYVGLFSFA